MIKEIPEYGIKIIVGEPGQSATGAYLQSRLKDEGYLWDKDDDKNFRERAEAFADGIESLLLGLAPVLNRVSDQELADSVSLAVEAWNNNCDNALSQADQNVAPDSLQQKHDRLTTQAKATHNALSELCELHRPTYELSPEGRNYLRKLDDILAASPATPKRRPKPA